VLRGFRHTLFILLQLGLVLSAVAAFLVEPRAWQAVLVCLTGGLIVVWIGEKLARRWLKSTIGRLRRVAEDIGHGRPATPLPANPGDDLYKLVRAFNLLASRIEEASREQKRLQEQLRRSERLATLGELAASVAHEINNPLDGLQSCVRILRRSLDDPTRAGQMLDLIDSGLARIDLIVRRLLTLARQNAVRPVRTRLGEVLDSALKAMAGQLESRRIEVRRRFETADDLVLGDPALLEQVFVNLLTNASDAMEAEGGVLTLVLRREEESGEAPGSCGPVLVVEVQDTGPGIPPDILPRIFEPFYTTKTDGRGTGLGLPIAARIIDAHRGSITVRTTEPRGTVFCVRIPALVSAAPASSAGASSPAVLVE